MRSANREKIQACLDGVLDRNRARSANTRTTRFRLRIIRAIREGKIETIQDARDLADSLNGATAVEISPNIATITHFILPGGPVLIFSNGLFVGYLRNELPEEPEKLRS